jgi:hypothetical protein
MGFPRYCFALSKPGQSLPWESELPLDAFAGPRSRKKRVQPKRRSKFLSGTLIKAELYHLESWSATAVRPG